jgi:hypothetical protein
MNANAQVGLHNAKGQLLGPHLTVMEVLLSSYDRQTDWCEPPGGEGGGLC